MMKGELEKSSNDERLVRCSFCSKAILGGVGWNREISPKLSSSPKKAQKPAFADHHLPQTRGAKSIIEPKAT